MSEKQAPVSQGFLLRALKSVFGERGKRYRKFRQILARPAAPGEVVVSITSSGKETTNTACEGDFVVKNLTQAMELYVVSKNKFSTLYIFVADNKDGWKRYEPCGEVFALEIEEQVVRLLECNSPFEIEAPWGERQKAELADFLATPVDGAQIYRIAREEFLQTYERCIVD